MKFRLLRLKGVPEAVTDAPCILNACPASRYALQELSSHRLCSEQSRWKKHDLFRNHPGTGIRKAAICQRGWHMNTMLKTPIQQNPCDEELDQSAQAKKKKESNSPTIFAQKRPASWPVACAQIRPVYRSGDLTVICTQKAVYRKGERILVTAAEYFVLLGLLENCTLFCTVGTIAKSAQTFCKEGLRPSGIARHICALRRKLGTHDGREYIITHRGKGYKWNLCVSRQTLNDPSLHTLHTQAGRLPE